MIDVVVTVAEVAVAVVTVVVVAVTEVAVADVFVMVDVVHELQRAGQMVGSRSTELQSS